MLKFRDLLALSSIQLKDFKVHCASGSQWTPLEAFFEGKFKLWQECQNKKNFECHQIISLITLGSDKWLFAGVWRVKGVQTGSWKEGECYSYDTAEIPGLEHLTGKAIIHFKKPFRASYLKDPKYLDQMTLHSLRPERMTIGDFPGFNSAFLSHRMLKTIVGEQNPSWKSALSNVAGVYLIVDRSTGKQYVGSAYGGEGIWQRWSNYCVTGHGGNKELRELLKSKGASHAGEFQFFLLEVCDLGASDDYVISRENQWKDALLTRDFGLNAN